MPKYLKPIIILTLLVFVSAEAPGQTGRLGFFINAAGFFPGNKNMNVGYGSGLGIVFQINPKTSVSLEWKYSQIHVDKEEGQFFGGTLRSSPLLVSIQYKLSASESFFPYVFAGGGLFFNSLRLDEKINLQELNIRKQNIKTGMGFMGGIGIMVKLEENLSLFMEGLYLFRRSDVETLYTDNSSSSVFKANLSSLSALIGILYRH
jgi:opacity protein-like surface antigen